MKAAVTVRGEYSLQVFKRGVLLRESCVFPNLITRYGLNALGGPSTLWHHYLHLGKGEAVPTFEDTALTNFTVSLLNSNGFTSSIDTNNFWLKLVKSWTFIGGTGKGNITEIGIGASATTNLFSKALVKDALGNVTSFFVLDDEDLVVNYTLYVKQNTASVSGAVDGVPYTVSPRFIGTLGGAGWEWRKSGLFLIDTTTNLNKRYTGSVVGPAFEPGGTGTAYVSADITEYAYVANSFTKTAKLSLNNSGAPELVTSIGWVQGVTSWQAEFIPAISVPTQYKLDIDVSITWAEASGVPYDSPR